MSKVAKNAAAAEAKKKMQKEAKRYKDFYGDQLDWYSSDCEKDRYQATNNYYPDHNFGALFKDKDEAVQCELLQAANIEIDPSLLSYEQRMALYLKEFGYTTSAHGIPMIVQATNKYSRTIWSILYLMSFSMFWYQISRVIEKYNKNEKIVDIQLIFEAAAFPAITVCNLNPYKKSAAAEVSLVQRTYTTFQLKAFDDVMNAAAAPKSKDGGGHHMRMRRSPHVTFEVARSVCNDNAGMYEALKETKPDENQKMCLCSFDRLAGDAFPCYPEEEWTDPHNPEQCASCTAENNCHKEGAPNNGGPCICEQRGFCLKLESDPEHILNLWEFYGNVAPTEDPAFLEALGFAGMTDEVAIVTKAKENIVFAMATLGSEERSDLSYQKDEFILKCSFNQKQCDIEKFLSGSPVAYVSGKLRDFVTRVDPIFGNCFTFNHNRSYDFRSLRAGSSYGLRLVVYVNASEYLPTTEAAGIKMTIHEKSEYPFPDTFGYNAPVGYVSSFGIKLKRMSRLSFPYGDCVLPGAEDSQVYIYEGYDYTTEGCFRTCFQTLVFQDCHCGDPRFPLADNLPTPEPDMPIKHCEAVDPKARECLDRNTKEKKTEKQKCRCQQPCKSSTYSVTYSASVWPSPSLKMQLGKCDGEHSECITHYKENGAMVEVFYEELSYEMLSESPAYGIVALLADFGGQFGLWLGVSVITCFEFIFLVIQVTLMSLWHKIEELHKEHIRKTRGPQGDD